MTPPKHQQTDNHNMRAAVFTLCLATTVLATTDTALADRVYIRDTLHVPLRAGQSTEHRILHRGLPSGTELQRLEVNDETGFTRVRTQGGVEGWMRSQYLVDKPIASMRLDGMKERLTELEAEHQQSLLRLRDAREENETLIASQSNLTAEKDKLAAELRKLTDLSANVVAINAENRRLNEDREALLAEVTRLNEQNAALSDDSAQDWLMRGAGILLLGLVFGIWMGRRIYQRRSNSGWA